MRPMSGFVLALRFALEIGLLAALGVAGLALPWSPRWPVVAALALPLAAAVTWGAWVAPKAHRRLDDPARGALELVLFGLGVAGLVVAGRPVLAATFGVLVVGHLVAMVALGLRGR